jgi:hypothetical protein
MQATGTVESSASSAASTASGIGPTRQPKREFPAPAEALGTDRNFDDKTIPFGPVGQPKGRHVAQFFVRSDLSD